MRATESDAAAAAPEPPPETLPAAAPLAPPEQMTALAPSPPSLPPPASPPPSRSTSEPVVSQLAATHPSQRSRVFHKLQFGLGLRLLRYDSYVTDPDFAPAAKHYNQAATLGTTWPEVTLGYGLSDALIVSGTASWSSQHDAIRGAPDETSSDLGFSGALDYLFHASPLFVGVAFGVDAYAGKNAHDELTQTMWIVEGRVGTHLFLAESVSLDPLFCAGYVTGANVVRTTDGTIFINDSNRSAASVTVLALHIGLGLSVWL
ncbi:MAG TPA: hypothetical protein VF331_15410 [Polyangiales bacterium]